MKISPPPTPKSPPIMPVRKARNREAHGGAWSTRSAACSTCSVMHNDARLWHPWLRIIRVLRVMLQTRWSTEAWPQVKAEFKKALALRSQIRRAGRFD